MEKTSENNIYRDEPVFCGETYYVKYTPDWDRRRRIIGTIQARYFSNKNGHFVDKGCDNYGIRDEVYRLNEEEWKAAVKQYANFDWN